MSVQPKKEFALVNYDICNPYTCNPDEGVCAAVKACTHKVIKQIDGVFEPPIVFQDLCMGCWDCIEACPLDAVQMKHIN
jgi:translation initiation factor RLI1